MRKIIYRVGDVFEADVPVVAHGVNTKYKFGSGVAAVISKRFPEVRKRYLEKPTWTLGDIQPVKINSAYWIVNCATQENYGYDGKLYVKYDSFYKVFVELVEFLVDHGYKSCAIPRMGSGLAGGDWNIIESIINKVIKYTPVDIIVYTLPT